MWRTNFAGGKVYHDERIMRRRDGTSFWCRVRGRSRNLADPFAEALYCFEPMNRAIAGNASLISDRQKQVLTLVSQGKTNAQIAQEIGLSKRTIEAHRARIMRSLWPAQQRRAHRLVFILALVKLRRDRGGSVCVCALRSWSNLL